MIRLNSRVFEFVSLVALCIISQYAEAGSTERSTRPETTSAFPVVRSQIAIGESARDVSAALGAPKTVALTSRDEYWGYLRGNGEIVVCFHAMRVVCVQGSGVEAPTLQLDSNLIVSSAAGHPSTAIKIQRKGILYEFSQQDNHGRIARAGVSTSSAYIAAPSMFEAMRIPGLTPEEPYTSSDAAAYVQKLTCDGTSHFRLAFGGRGIRCQDGAFSRTFYAGQPRADVSRLLGTQNTTRFAVSDVSLPSSTSANQVWFSGLEATPNGQRFLETSAISQSFEYTYNHNDPPISFDLLIYDPSVPGMPTTSARISRVKSRHSDAFPMTNGFTYLAQNCPFTIVDNLPTSTGSCTWSFVPAGNRRVCPILVEHATSGDFYSQPICTYLASYENRDFPHLPYAARSNATGDIDFRTLKSIEPLNLHNEVRTGSSLFLGGKQPTFKAAVDLSSGAGWLEQCDFSLSGPFGLSFIRWYDSYAASYQGSSGVGWRTIADVFLDVSLIGERTAAFSNLDGSKSYFSTVIAGIPDYDQFSGSSLLEKTDGTFQLTTWDAYVLSFDVNGRLTQIADRFGNVQTYSRNSAGILTMITDALGKSLSLSYDGNNRLISVQSAPAGKSVTLTYDSGVNCFVGDLCSVTESDGHAYSYQYFNPSSYGGAHLLQSIVDPTGRVLSSRTYDDDRRVATESVGTQSTPASISYLDSFGSECSTVVPDGGFNSCSASTIVDTLSRTTTAAIDSIQASVGSVSGPLCRCETGAFTITSDVFNRITAITAGVSIAADYGEDTLYTAPDVIESYVIKAVPALTSVSSTFSSLNATYYPIGDARQDLVETLTKASTDTPGRSAVTTFNYSSSGQLRSISKAGFVNGTATTRTVSYNYDQRGRLLTQFGPRTDVNEAMTLAYYPDSDADISRRGQLQSITNSLGQQTTYASTSKGTYSIDGFPYAVIDANGSMQSYSYDALGRVLTSTQQNNTSSSQTSYTYDAAGRLISRQKPNGGTTLLSYDAVGAVLSEQHASASASPFEELAFSYDSMEQALGTTAVPCSNGTCSGSVTANYTTSYDNTGRPITVAVSSASKAISYGGNLPATQTASTLFAGSIGALSVSDSAGTEFSNSFSYDLDGRLLSATDMVQSRAFLLDANSDILNVTRAAVSSLSQVAELSAATYDDFGEETHGVDDRGGAQSYTYDADGNVATSIDGSLRMTTYTRDALGRIVNEVSGAPGAVSEMVSAQYDDPTPGHFGIGRLKSLTDLSGVTTYTYEYRGLMASTSKAASSPNVAYTSSYIYDGDGNIVSEVTPGGRTLAFAFDLADRPIGVKSTTATYVSNVLYEPFGPIAQLAFGNGTVESTSYDARYRPAEEILTNSSGNKLSDLISTYDGADRLLNVTDLLNPAYNISATYTNGQLGSVVSGSALYGTATYKSDGLFDLTSEKFTSYNGAAHSIQFQFGPRASQPINALIDNSTFPITYLLDGSEASIGTSTYKYSSRGLLSSADGITYIYDARQRRVAATSSTGTDAYVYDFLGRLVAETGTASNAFQHEYIWLGDRPVAQEDTASTRFSVTDYARDVFLQTDGTGAIVWQADYEPYGAVYALRTSNVHQPFRRDGYEAELLNDALGANGSTSRYYGRDGWYRPTWGRFTQRTTGLGQVDAISDYGYGLSTPLNSWGSNQDLRSISTRLSLDDFRSVSNSSVLDRRVTPTSDSAARPGIVYSGRDTIACSAFSELDSSLPCIVSADALRPFINL